MFTTELEEEDQISTDDFDVPLRKRVAQILVVQFISQQFSRLSKKAIRFINKQFIFVVITFFILSLNVVSLPLSAEAESSNPLINYDPDAVTQASSAINPYIPIINQADPKELANQVQ